MKATQLKKMLQQLDEKNKKANEAFEKLTPAEKRIQLARDVLAQLKRGDIEAERGTWLQADVPTTTVDLNTDLQTLLQATEVCKACAFGSLFVAAVKRKNDFKVLDIKGLHLTGVDEREIEDIQLDFDEMANYMGPFFTKDQISLIESAFEGGGLHNNKKSINFLEEVDASDPWLDDSIRLRLVMENIVANDGTFKPNKKPTERDSYTNEWKTPGFVR